MVVCANVAVWGGNGRGGEGGVKGGKEEGREEEKGKEERTKKLAYHCSFFGMGCISKYYFPPRVTGNLKPCLEWFLNKIFRAKQTALWDRQSMSWGEKIILAELAEQYSVKDSGLEPEEMNSDPSTHISKD